MGAANKILTIVLLIVVWMVAACAAVGAINVIVNYPTSTWATRAIALLCALAFLLVLIPIIVWVQFADARKKKLFIERKRLGLCVHCGYDISGASGKCPECGKWTVRQTPR